MSSQGPPCDARTGKHMLIICVECFFVIFVVIEMSVAIVLGVVLACRCVRRDCRCAETQYGSRHSFHVCAWEL